MSCVSDVARAVRCVPVLYTHHSDAENEAVGKRCPVCMMTQPYQVQYMFQGILYRVFFWFFFLGGWGGGIGGKDSGRQDN